MKLLLGLYLSLLTFKDVSLRKCYASDLKAVMLGKPADISVQDCSTNLKELSKIGGLEKITANVASMLSPRCFTFTGVSNDGNETVIKGCIPVGFCSTLKPIFKKMVENLSNSIANMTQPTADVTVPPPKVRRFNKADCVECNADECNSGANKEKLFVFNIVLLLFLFLLI